MPNKYGPNSEKQLTTGRVRKLRIDFYGRIFIGKEFLAKYKNNLLELKLESRNKLIVKVMKGSVS